MLIWVANLQIYIENRTFLPIKKYKIVLFSSYHFVTVIIISENKR